MSKEPILKKEESIIIDDKNNTINDEEKDNKDKKIIKSQIIKRTIEYQSPLFLDINSSQNLKDEPKKSFQEKRTAVCWNCENHITVKEGWEIVECSECHKLNRIPQNVGGTIDQQISVAKSYGNLNQDVPYIYGIAVCPICETENKFRKNANNISCIQCGNYINLNTNNNLFNNYNQNNIGNNFINRSYDFSSPMRYINTPYSPYNPYNFIQLRGFMPFPPICNGNCSECTLNKILKALKKRPKETYIPYPMFPYGYDEPKKEIRYIPINTESKKTEPDDEFKIVIRKKPKNRNAQSLKKYNYSKNKAFEKVFFSKLK